MVERLPNLPDIAALQRAALLGSVLLATVAPDIASAHQTDHINHPLVVTDQAPPTFGSTNAKIPEDVKRFIRHNVAYLKPAGCSGLTIRNDHSQIIGVATAQHCGFLESEAPRLNGSDGRRYAVIEPVKVQLGARAKHLRTVATIGRFIVPKSNTYDIALGVVAGQSPAEVERTYEKELLTPDQLSEQKVGATVFEAAWPVGQFNNHTGENERQTFVAKLIGLGQANTTMTQELDTAWASVTATRDGASCSYGASGSAGLIVYKHRLRPIGVLSIFDDLSGTFATRPYFPTDSPTLSKGNVVADCGFAYELPYPFEREVIHLVKSPEQVPGYETSDQIIADARATFTDETVAKPVIDGLVVLPDYKGGGPVGREMAPGLEVTDPAIYHDKLHEATVLEYASPADPEQIGVSYLPDSLLSQAVVYPHDSQATNVTVLKTVGKIQYQPDSSQETEGTFTDQNGLHFGGVYTKSHDISGRSFSITYQNNQPVLEPNLSKQRVG